MPIQWILGLEDYSRGRTIEYVDKSAWSGVSDLTNGLDALSLKTKSKQLTSLHSKPIRPLNQSLKPQKKARSRIRKRKLKAVGAQSVLALSNVELHKRHMDFIRECPQIESSKIDKSIYDAYLYKSLKEHANYCEMRPSTHESVFKLLLEAEEAHSEVELRRFDTARILVSVVRDGESGKLMNQITVPNVSRGEPSIVPSDIVVVSDANDRHTICTIQDIYKDHLKFNVSSSKGKQNRLLAKGYYRVRFASSGTCTRRFLEALKALKTNHQLTKALFNVPVWKFTVIEAKIDIRKTNSSMLEVRLNRQNECQQKAITNILKAHCRPRPYVIFGPPGTGKTSTLVELTIQIYNRDRSSRILVVGSSNNCVDKLAADLHSTGLLKSLVRYSSKMHAKSLSAMPQYYTLDFWDCRAFRIVVTTNSMSSKLKKNYDFVIIDEAGHASEPEVLIPMIMCKQDGCIVLAGDPEQLGPVIKSQQAETLGLGRSLLVRLIQTVSDYKFENGSFNERFITRLVECYRCDPRVLALSNRLFYQDQLICHNKTPSNLLQFMGVKKPNIFVNVDHGKDTRDPDTVSRHNVAEVKVCIDQILGLYHMGIEPNQIGVITPYKAQRDKLLLKLRQRLSGGEAAILDKKFMLNVDCKPKSKNNHSEQNANMPKGRKIDWNCKIDTVDGFQGNERDIILISLVRTCETSKEGRISKSFMFIDDEKRFNVTLSRAKWMNIVIGHKQSILKSKMWSQYLESAEVVTPNSVRKAKN